MSLRDVLTSVWRPPSLPDGPSELRKTAAALEREWADSKPRIPSPFELGEIWRRIGDRWLTDSTLVDLPLSDGRWMPYVVFYPHDDRGEWLASDARFLQEFLAFIRAVPRLVVASIREVLLHYPSDLITFALLRRGLVDLLGTDSKSPRLAEWNRRIRKYSLLDDAGPSLFAQLLYTSEVPIPEVLSDAGLVDDLEAAEFLRHVTHEILVELAAELEEQPGASALERPLSFVAPSKRLRFDDEPEHVAHALLLPHTKVNPRADTKRAIETFLLQHFGDPRFHRNMWQRVKNEALAVLLRWIVGGTLDDFFRLISRNALERHWKYRQAFWRAYLRNDLISDAWVVLGDEARRTARQAWKDAAPSYAILYGTGEPNHSVLLLKIGSLIIAEWSHNGKCRIWKAGNEAQPGFYERLYRRAELRDDPDFEIVHHSSDTYNWQGRLAGYIRRETGYEVRLADYRLR